MNDSALAETLEERQIVCRVEQLADEIAESAAPIWHWGDGYGGYVRVLLNRAFVRAGLHLEPDRGASERKRTVSRRLRDLVIARDGLKCCYCGKQLEPKDATVDHVIAVHNGGSDDLANLVMACRSCNSRKGSKP